MKEKSSPQAEGVQGKLPDKSFEGKWIKLGSKLSALPGLGRGRWSCFPNDWDGSRVIPREGARLQGAEKSAVFGISPNAIGKGSRETNIPVSSEHSTEIH